MISLSRFLLLIGPFYVSAVILPVTSERDCPYWKNVSEFHEIGRLSFDYGPEEECLYYFLLDKEHSLSRDFRSIHDRPPPGKDINITVDALHIEHVELAKGSTSQFTIYGQMDLMWMDSRLTWNEEEFSRVSLIMNNPHMIWTPTMIDHALCTDKSTCELTYMDVEVQSDGTVSARLHFRYAAFCYLDFTRYPEEENNCCIYFTAYERISIVRFNKMEDQVIKPRRPVVMKESLDMDTEISRLTQDHSAWLVEEQTHGVTHLAGIESLSALKVCVKAVKKMSTLKMALRLPVTMATLLMLVAPLFGDLRTQAYVKLITLCLQTVCFLYLCSMAPENGFAGQKPKIYRFYESIFGLTTISLLITVCCMALSRAKRTVPPSHRVYLSAKLVNRAVCCIEPEDSAHYQRYLETENQTAPNELNYTQDWRHIYMAVNNLFSGLFFTTFLFFIILDLM